MNIKLITPLEKNLSVQQKALTQAFRKIVENEKLQVANSLETDRIEDRFKNFQRCQGLLVIAFSQWQAQRLYRDQNKNRIITSEFIHIGIVMAVAAKKPLLVLREKNVTTRGTLTAGYVHPVIDLPSNAQPGWLQTPAFVNPFNDWLRKVRDHRHVFLGYSTGARSTALLIRNYIENTLKLSVLDWHDYLASGIIVKNLEESERLTGCGIFLFMADGTVEFNDSQFGAPLDNVIYEAGFFAGTKGQSTTLIIREKGAKIPTDLGGVIYLELENRNNIAPIETRLREYLKSVLNVNY